MGFPEIIIGLAAIGLPFLLLLLPFVFVLALVWMLKGRKKSAGLSPDEARQLEQVWRRLERLETRIGNLETIMMGHSQPAASGTARN